MIAHHFLPYEIILKCSILKTKPGGETSSKTQPANRPTRRSPGKFLLLTYFVFLIPTSILTELFKKLTKRLRL